MVRISPASGDTSAIAMARACHVFAYAALTFLSFHVAVKVRQVLGSAGPASRRHHSACPSDVGPRPSGGRGTTDATGPRRPSRLPASAAPPRGEARSACRAGWGIRPPRAPHRQSGASRAASPHHSRHHDELPTDTAPPASQTPLPPPHSSHSVPDLAPSHHTHFHLRFFRRFRPKM
jgi:hypothetical protein